MNKYELFIKIIAGACFSDLQVDPHLGDYNTAQQWFSRRLPDHLGDISPETRQRMIDKDCVIELHIYPDTPIGMYVFFGASVEEVVDEVIAHEDLVHLASRPRKQKSAYLGRQAKDLGSDGR